MSDTNTTQIESGKAMEVIAAAPKPLPPLGADARTQAVADAYDQVPYQSKPFAQTTPEQLWAMATLFGLNPPDVATARVLEIGCSAGGNLIPLAARFPQMHCVGVDISAVEIGHGLAQVQALKLTNCELLALDITQAKNLLKGPFDFIVCHGVFSWVPPVVRDAILDVTRDLLSPHGVAYLSYNVYPGWKMREVVREMMMFHAGGLKEPGPRLAQAKAILEFTKNQSNEQSTYGKMLRDEAALVSRAEDYYLLHEYLELENHPMYFRDFMALAGARQLAYLGEAALADMAPQRLGKEVFETLSRLSQGNILATEQYMDIFTNRTFRQTLLVHEAQAPKINRNLAPASLTRFAFSTSMVADTEFTPQAGQAPMARFKDAFGRTLAANSPFSVAMLQSLVAAKPYPLGFAALTGEIRKVLGTGLGQTTDEQLGNLLGAELLNLLVQNVVRLHGQALLPPAPDLAKPNAFALARAQAAAGQDWATNLLHQPVAISPAHRVVLQALDGSKDAEAMAAHVFAALQTGQLKAQQNGQDVTDTAALQQLSGQFYAQALRDFRNLALLQA